MRANALYTTCIACTTTSRTCSPRRPHGCATARCRDRGLPPVAHPGPVSPACVRRPRRQLGQDSELAAREKSAALLEQLRQYNVDVQRLHAHHALLQAWRQMVAVALVEGFAVLSCVVAPLANCCVHARRALTWGGACMIARPGLQAGAARGRPGRARPSAPAAHCGGAHHRSRDVGHAHRGPPAHHDAPAAAAPAAGALRRQNALPARLRPPLTLCGLFGVAAAVISQDILLSTGAGAPEALASYESSAVSTLGVDQLLEILRVATTCIVQPTTSIVRGACATRAGWLSKWHCPCGS